MRVDSHQHFWKYDPNTYSWINDLLIQKDFLPEDLVPHLMENSIDGCVAVQADQSEKETRLLLKLASENRFVKGVVGWVDLSSDNVAESLNIYAKNPKFKGVRHTVWDSKGEFMLDSVFQNGIEHLKDFNLTYDILVFERQLASAVKLIGKFPDHKFVLDHIGKPDFTKLPSEEWIFQIKKIAEYKNVFCKISGWFSDLNGFNIKKVNLSPFLDVLVPIFGTERLMFGSDWPICLTSASYKEVLGVVDNYFSENEKTDVLGKSASRFYSLI